MFINIYHYIDLEIGNVDCIYLHRYRYGHTRNQFREHVYKYNIQEDIEKH